MHKTGFFAVAKGAPLTLRSGQSVGEVPDAAANGPVGSGKAH